MAVRPKSMVIKRGKTEQTLPWGLNDSVDNLLRIFVTMALPGHGQIHEKNNPPSKPQQANKTEEELR